MKTILEPKKFSLLLRLACLIFVLGFTPFAVVGLHNEGNDYVSFFFGGFMIMLVPELYIKLFSKPVSAVLEENKIVIKYYYGTLKQVPLYEIKGYSATEEWTRYGTKRGVLLYMRNSAHVDFTEINIKDLSPLMNYLHLIDVSYYGSERLRPWFLSKYEYDRY